MNVEQIRAAVRDDRNLAFLLQLLGARKRERPVTDIYRARLDVVKSGFFLTIEDSMAAFETLQKLGAGRIVRQNAKLPAHPAFQWKHSVQELAQVALKGLKVLNDGGPVPSRVKPSQTNTVDLYAHVRGTPVLLQLPRDFNRRDARELARFLELAAIRNESGS